ncbi:MAG: biotin--[acetyl-CoA-carboxylase] ligase [Sphingobacteriales bacterium]|nr:biotin--[acetyl-CoA-carboxylase] ligase [Sphingobacteriales bacterium]
MQSVDSTNNYARKLIHDKLAQHGMAIFGHEQLAGKGQRGKIWLSEKDANILLSILLKPGPLQLSQQFRLSACMAVAVHDFFQKYAGEATAIKWPNDLYWQDRKAGGLLVESVVRSQPSGTGVWDWAIAGIGININQTSFSAQLPNPVSLKQITGNDFKTVLLAKELYAITEKYFQELITEGFEDIYSKYISRLYKKGSIARLKKDNRIFEATIKTVSSSGQLVVQHSIEEEFDFGEVEWLI